HLRHVPVDLADMFSDVKLALDEAQRNIITVAQGSQSGFAHLLDTRHREGADGSEGQRKPGGFDGCGCGCRVAFGTQQSRGPRLPLRGELLYASSAGLFVERPQVPVPSWRDDTSSVTGSCAEPAVGPGNPRDFRLLAGQIFDEFPVGGRAGSGAQR